jgi:LEA14-like dessication related protein
MKAAQPRPAGSLFPLLSIVLIMVAGCAGLGKQLDPPRVKLANIQVREVRMLETAFEVQLRVFNTNDTALEIKGFECDIELNGEPFAMGVSKAEIKIPSYDTALLPIRVYSSVIAMAKSFHGLQKNEQLQYRLKGTLRLGKNAFSTHLPFESEGIFSFKDIVEKK